MIGSELFVVVCGLLLIMFLSGILILGLLLVGFIVGKLL